MHFSRFTIFIVILLIFPASLSAQKNPVPNELKGYEFFGKGKLKSIKVGVSKKEDVEKLFGSMCEKDPCVYDANFFIKFDYLDLGDCMTTQKIRDRAMCPLEKYIGGIESITLTPRTSINIERIDTAVFNERTGGGIFPKGGGKSIYYESFSDKFGLSYSFLKNHGITHFPIPKEVGGELYSVYKIAEELEAEIFSAPFRRSD